MTDTVPAPSYGSGRFVLRSWRPDEAGTLTALVLRSLDHLRPWQPWASAEPVSVEDRERSIVNWSEQRLAGGDAIYGMFADGDPVGNCGLHRRLGPSGLEIGYWVAVDHVRRGYATEAARLLTEAAFGLAGIDIVEIHHDEANVASAGIPRRLGYRLVERRAGGVGAVGDTGIECIWRTDRTEWTDRHADPER